jgi:hypothetical protein
MTYADRPAALQLRAMNIIYETTKERGATILIPTPMVDSLNPVVALALSHPARRKRLSPRPELPTRDGSSTGKGAVWYSTRGLFLGARLAEGCRDFLLLYARLRVATLAEILLFGAVTHHAGISHLGSRLGFGPGFLRHA